jgi:hypothetical protein
MEEAVAYFMTLNQGKRSSSSKYLMFLLSFTEWLYESMLSSATFATVATYMVISPVLICINNQCVPDFFSLIQITTTMKALNFPVNKDNNNSWKMWKAETEIMVVIMKWHCKVRNLEENGKAVMEFQN